MKKIISFLFVLLFIGIIGCSNDSGNPTGTGGFGGNGNGGGNNTGNVTFAIMSQAGQNGGTELLAKPSVDVTMTSVNVKVTAANFDETYTDDGTTVYPKDQWVLINEYTNVTTGMQFIIRFIGKTSPANQSFDVTSNYTIP